MDRIIEVKVSGDYISKDNNFAGVCGSGNVTCLRITFDKDWKEYAKKITFWNARGLNPVEITLTTNLLEDTPENTEVTEVYIVTIPAEPLEFSGMLTFVVEGYDAVKDENGNIIGEKRVRCVPCELEVEDAPVAAGLPVDPTPTQAEQLQEQIDEIIDTIHEAVEAKEAIENMSVSAEKLESNEEVFVKKTIQDEVVNLHFGLAKGDSAYDIAVKHGYEGTEEEWNAAVNEARVSAESSAIEAKAWADYAEETVAATAKKDLSNVSEEILCDRVYKLVEATSDDGVNYVATVEGLVELYNGAKIRVIPNMDIEESAYGKTLNVNGLGAKSLRPTNLNSSNPVSVANKWFVKGVAHDLVYNASLSTWTCTNVTHLYIANNLLSEGTASVLSARQGKVLNEKIGALDARLETVEAEVMPVKSIVAETLTSDYISPISGVHLVVKDKYYSIPDGYKCTSIKVKIISENMTCEDGDAYLNFLGQDESHSSFDNPSGTFSLDTVNLSEGDNFITEIPEECKEIFVTVEKEVASEESSCTIDVEITYEGASKLDERLTAIEGEVESSKPVTVKTTSLTVPANGSVTYTTLWNYALVGLTTYTDHELAVDNDYYLRSDLYVTDPNNMGYIAKSIETGVAFDFATDVREDVNQGMPYPTDGGNLGLKFWNNTDTDIIVQISESRLNEELLEYLVTTGQHNADKVFPSVDTFWSMDSLSGSVSFTTKYNDMVVTHERNIYYYDPTEEYSESPSGKIGICRDYVAINQQSATNCTRYQWFKDFEGNEYYRELTSGTVTQTVNDDGSYTWEISNWTVSSDWERIDLSRDEFEANVVKISGLSSRITNISQESPKSDSPAISSSYLSGEVCYGSYRFYKPNNRTYFDPSLGYKRQTFFDAPSINGEGEYTGYIMNYMHGNTVNDDITIAQWFTNVQDNSMWYRNGTGSGLHSVDGDENGVWYAPQYVNFNEWVRIDAGDVLTKTNTTSFTPTSAYHPATKKYVDDSVSAAGGGDMLKNVYDTDGDGIVDNAGMLGGQPPSYYATATALDGRAIRSHASAADTYGLGNTSLYGHLKVADNLTTTTIRGIALSANQGRVLNEKITALQTPPTLTSVTTDGVAIGTDNWTGTGYFCTSSGTKYVVTHNVSTATSSTTASIINGFNRFCLKPAEATREWQNWTPYFVYNGASYEFFYSPSRGLYEALIPATELTAAQVLTYIEWKRYAPTILNYGKLRALCYFDIKDTTSGTVTEERRWIASEPILRDTSGEITEEDYQKAQWFIGRDWWLELSSLDVASLSLIFLLMDVSGNGRIVNASALYLQNIVMGSITQLPIETIDNFS